MVRIKKGSESDLMAAVANVGPVSVAIDGNSNAFRVTVYISDYSHNYKSNIACSFMTAEYMTLLGAPVPS